MSDHLIRILTHDGSIRATAAVTTQLAEDIRRRQQSDPTATVAIGRLATAAALMSSLLKDRQRLALMIEGNGPLQKLQAEADADGHIRASLKVPQAGLPPKENRFDVAGAVGQAGFLHVIKDLGLKEPYRGMVQLYSSEIAEDIAYYFTTSEQTPSTVALGVELDAQARVKTAGGFLLQLMPGADESLVDLLETQLQRLPPVTTLLTQGQSPAAILKQLLGPLPYDTLAETGVTFQCLCSRAKTSSFLQLMTPAEREALLREQGQIEITCEYCKERYRFTRDELTAFRSPA